MKTPADFDSETFRQVVAEAHAFCNVELVEIVCFKEPHADRKPHFNLLVRAHCIVIRKRGECRWAGEREGTVPGTRSPGTMSDME